MARTAVVTMLAGMVLVSGGCVAVLAGAGAAGTAVYVTGALEAAEAKDLTTVYAAADKAVQDLRLNVITKGKDALTGEIVARDTQDKKITITMEATAEGATKLKIRVGTFGNKTKSQLIYQKIRENLK
jgi:hypothetical protein